MLFGSADGEEQLLRILFLLLSLFFKLSVPKISDFALFHCKMTEMLFLLLQRFPVDIIEILFVNIFSRGLESLQQESYLATFCIGVALLMNNEARLFERSVYGGNLLRTCGLTFAHRLGMKVRFAGESGEMVGFLMVDFADEVDKTTDLGLFYHADKFNDLGAEIIG